ncbi:ABC transporter substrate-binding protein [Frigidibacter sp. ROC022]|uniref:ABC transporter substrate-binding protein n=1 Tax=Frigidibacter sp. ROC022 TaxID=2971796 RepID=UPI00215B69C8|nr:ABC transporter substrate-binding protein [Frigidibacter sp. ROC022]MCR8723718.1 ABC transporter substrate-binding protein [Frigidibacter sp. ROC022]
MTRPTTIPRSIGTNALAAVMALLGVLPGAALAESATEVLAAVAIDQALADRVPARIRSAGVLTIGSDNAYAPWEYLAGDDGQTPEGIDVDIAAAIGKTLGVEIAFQTSAFDAIIPSLGSKFDLGISAFSITNERMKVVNFVSYTVSGSLWAVAAGNPKGFDPADYCGTTIAVQSGTYHERILTEESAGCEAEGKPAITLLPFDTQPEALTRIAAGGADATISGGATIGYAAAQSRGSLEVILPVGGILAESGINGIAVAKADDELTRLIADTMNAMIANGSYVGILEHWGVGSSAVSEAVINPEVGE